MSTQALSSSARSHRTARAVASTMRPAMAVTALLTALLAALLIAGCADPTLAPSATAVVAPAAVAATAASPAVSTTGAQPPSGAATAAPTDVRTRNALFKPSRFAELPGWTGDDLLTAWDAFAGSCKALEQREAWKPLCANAGRVARNTADIRRFFETEFALFRLLNIDATAEGDVTGYYEPLIAGSMRSEGAYTVPVYGVPNDLYTLDWKDVPAGQRGATVHVAVRGRDLIVLPTRQPGSYALDTSRFQPDSRDRRWRIRLDNGRAMPYRTRSEIESLGRLDAPVVAWVDDALALYAMQVQGSGRIRLSDGTSLRLQYAEQNGHAFKPLRLASRAPDRVVTRSARPESDVPERFALADDPGSNPPADSRVPILTRGAKPVAHDAPAGPRASNERGGDLVSELLAGAQRKPAPPSPVAAAAAGKPKDVSTAGAPRVTALDSDPSYVFFRAAPNQSAVSGPPGALGVPLTAGRSIAVDPRVTPMGYPVYISAPTPPGSSISLQRLVMAQDTGGAIRGAIRADFFWGFGSMAGRQAMRTRERGQMWLMLPRGEAARLQGAGLVTRGARLGGTLASHDAQCLIADETFCSELN